MLTFSSCHHKELCYDFNPRVKINVVFDWRNAPDATAQSMVLYMYGHDGSEPIRYVFDNPQGGPLSIPYGSYDGLCLDGDCTDWAELHNTRDADMFEVRTTDADVLEAYGISTHTMPRADDNATERVAKTPGMSWSNRCNNIDIPANTTEKTITFYPEEAVCHYTVDIYDVDNIASIEGASLDATISGMAEGYLHGQSCTTNAHVTMPFVLEASVPQATLHGEFLTFGECADHGPAHTLTVYMFLTDGSKMFYNFDVTDQVRKAPDPRHVHIVIHGLSLPKPLTESGGLHPSVDDWQAVYITLPM